MPLLGPATIALTVYLALVATKLTHGGPLAFPHFGEQFLHASSTSELITPKLGATSPVGYDGQYYFAIAVDPFHAKDYVPHELSPAFVYGRPLYPALARLFGFGSVRATAYAMIAINLVSVFAATLALSAWLRRRKAPVVYALLYALFPGLIFAVFRDLTEPLAFGLVAVAVWAFDRGTRHTVPAAAGLMALALLGRETTGVFGLVLAGVLAAQDRRWRHGPRAYLRAAAFLTTAVAPLAAWRVFLRVWLNSPVQERTGDGLSILIPGHAWVSYLPWSRVEALAVPTVVLPTLLALAALAALRLRGGDRWARAALALNAAIFVVFLPSPIAVDYGAAGRASLGVLLGVIYCLPSVRERMGHRQARALALVWSPLWFLLVALLLGAPGPSLIG
jgi:hypothetical protein